MTLKSTFETLSLWIVVGKCGQWNAPIIIVKVMIKVNNFDAKMPFTGVLFVSCSINKKYSFSNLQNQTCNNSTEPSNNHSIFQVYVIA